MPTPTARGNSIYSCWIRTLISSGPKCTWAPLMHKRKFFKIGELPEKITYEIGMLQITQDAQFKQGAGSAWRTFVISCD
jgi:hypothetical protein